MSRLRLAPAASWVARAALDCSSRNFKRIAAAAMSRRIPRPARRCCSSMASNELRTAAARLATLIIRSCCSWSKAASAALGAGGAGAAAAVGWLGGGAGVGAGVGAAAGAGAGVLATAAGARAGVGLTAGADAAEAGCERGAGTAAAGAGLPDPGGGGVAGGVVATGVDGGGGVGAAGSAGAAGVEGEASSDGAVVAELTPGGVTEAGVSVDAGLGPPLKSFKPANPITRTAASAPTATKSVRLEPEETAAGTGCDAVEGRGGADLAAGGGAATGCGAAGCSAGCGASSTARPFALATFPGSSGLPTSPV